MPTQFGDAVKLCGVAALLTVVLIHRCVGLQRSELQQDEQRVAWCEAVQHTVPEVVG